MTWRVLEADCVEAMKKMDEASVDAIVTDPPYGLEFMGKEWDRLGNIGQVSHSGPSERDGSTVFGRQRVTFNGSSNVRCRNCNKWKWGHKPGDDGGGGLACTCDKPDFPSVRPDQARLMQEWHQAWATEALRVLKPGGHLLAFGGTRTYHRLACAVEDAGFEIRDSCIWLYASGFPKSHNLNGDHEGWGTALKPAHEPIVVARKPLSGTVAQTVSEFGTGALNIAATRIAGTKPIMERTDTIVAANAMSGESTGATSTGEVTTEGRWPANVVLSHLPECKRVGERRVKGIVGGSRGASAQIYGGGKGLTDAQPEVTEMGYADLDGLETVEAWECAPGCAVAELDRQSGERRSAGEYEKGARGGPNDFQGPASIPIDGLTAAQYGDTGGGSRFFLSVQKSRIEECAGLVSDAELHSMRSQVPSSEASGGSAPDDADTRREPPTEGSRTPGATSQSEMDAGIESGANPETEASSPNLNPDGSGNVSTDQFPKGGRSTTGTGTKRTTRSKTSNSSKRERTTTSISESGKTTESAMESKSAGASDATPTSPSTPSTSGEREPLAATARSAPEPRTASGEPRTESEATLGTAPIESGTEPRFRYQAKASRAERNAGLEGFEEREAHKLDGGDFRPEGRNLTSKGLRHQNNHPTVKPVDLMRWLVRLVTPPEGTVLDPFVGSGTTGIACVLEGFDFVGVEREAEYCRIAEARIAWWDTHKDRADEILQLSAKSERERTEHRDAGQLSLEDAA